MLCDFQTAGRQATSQLAGGPSFLDSQAPRKTLCSSIAAAEPHLSLDHRAVDSSNRPIRVFVSTFSVCAVYMQRRSFFHLTSVFHVLYQRLSTCCVLRYSLPNLQSLASDSKIHNAQPPVHSIEANSDLPVVRRVNIR